MYRCLGVSWLSAVDSVQQVQSTKPLVVRKMTLDDATQRLHRQTGHDLQCVNLGSVEAPIQDTTVPDTHTVSGSQNLSFTQSHLLSSGRISACAGGREARQKSLRESQRLTSR